MNKLAAITGIGRTFRTKVAPVAPSGQRSWGPLAQDGAIWLLGFAPVVYLALAGGGYDIVARSQVAILLWWLVLLGVVVGLLPRGRLSGWGWAAVALLTAFMVWSWVAVGWSSSAERTLIEVGRLSAYLATLVLGLALIARSNARWLVNGLACAIALVAVLAVLSKLVPSWFPADTAQRFYATSRLSYPFDYSDGVGEFTALGLPLLLFAATGARSPLGRGLGAAAIPAVVLSIAMTASRGGVLATAVGLWFFFLLAPDRLPRLLAALPASAGGVVLVVALLDRQGISNQLTGAAPAGERHSLLAILIVTCLVVGAVQVAGTLLVRRRGWPGLTRRGDAVMAGVIVAIVVVAAIALAGTGELHHLWTQFKQPKPSAASTGYRRLLSVAGSHRYQYWQAAASAFDAHPWKGIGPGTFEFYWAQHNTLHEFVQNAHSLWLETLAELGIPGLTLIAGLFVLALVAGSARALRAARPERLVLATAVAGVAAFCAAASFDWVWQIGVIPMIAMLLVAVAVGPRTGQDPADDAYPDPRAWRRWTPRVAAAVLVLVGLWAIARPLAVTEEVRASQTAAGRGDFRVALSDAATARNIEPGAASPWLQRALLLEQLDDIAGAARAIVQAEHRQSTDWQIWFVASRIATEQDRPQDRPGRLPPRQTPESHVTDLRRIDGLHIRLCEAYHGSMHGLRRGLLVVGCAWGLVAPATALGVIILPPGKGANQYGEVVPSSQGNTLPPGASGSSGAPSSLPSLGSGRIGAARLAQLGSQGRAAAALARATAPQPFPRTSAGGSVKALRLGRTNGGSAAGALANALGGAGGLGVLFPGLLVVAALGALMLLVARLRRADNRTSAPEPSALSGGRRALAVGRPRADARPQPRTERLVSGAARVGRRLGPAGRS